MKVEAQADVTSLPLFDAETKQLTMEPGVTTVTFFKGNPQDAAAYVRDRFRAVAQLNPWVVGRTVRNRQHKNLQLAYPAGAISQELIDQAVWIEPPGLSIHPGMPYDALAAAVVKSKAQLDYGSKLVNKGDLVTRITITSDPTSPSAFGLVVSMSHVVADGYTYFTIMNMLSSAGEIKALNQRREVETDARMSSTCKASRDFVLSAGHLLNVMCGLVCGGKTKTVVRRVDAAKIAAAKADAKARGAEFVSTNDIITSNLGNLTGARVLLMALNHRGRVEGATAADAGNYEDTLAIDQGYFGTPEGVRQILKSGVPYECRKKDLPTCFEALRSQFAIISNWASFAEGLCIPGCEQLIQFPLCEASYIPYECAIIFKSNSKDTCVMYLTKKYKESYWTDNAPVGDVVSQSIFG